MATFILGLDLSLSRPGAAIIKVDEKKRKATVVSVSNIKTDAKQPYHVRGRSIEAWLHLFLAESKKTDKLTYIGRESYNGKFGHHSIYTSHVAADRALGNYGLVDTEKPIAQQSVKKTIVGRGKAEKEEVEKAVRKLTGYKGEFECSDESDAVAIALSIAINNDLVDGLGEWRG